MSSLTFAQKLRLQTHYGIVLCHSITESGEPFYHFIQADRKNIERLLGDQGNGKTLDFTSYGEIVLSGWGEHPTDADMEILNKLFPNDA